jgi:adenylate cyclase
VSEAGDFLRHLDRGVRLVVWIAILSAGVGAAYGALTRGVPLVGAMAGACNGGILSFLEIYVLGRWGRAALLRLPFAAYFALRVALYVVAVLALNAATLTLTGAATALAGIDRRDVEFALTVCVAVNLLFSVNELLGPGVLFAFAAGRYRRPRREERALLYLDLVGSTGLAERLGEERFLDFLNAFFADVTSDVAAEGGEIHKYVGDEVIAVWRAGTDAARPIRAALAARRRLEARAGFYRGEFGAAPTFRAAIHAGPVVIGELGAGKKEIALIGDAMNTAARILEAAREAGAGLLISAPYFNAMRAAPAGLSARRLAPIPLRGKSAPLALVALDAAAGGLPAATGPI